MEQAGTKPISGKESINRPLILTILCLFSFVFFGLISLLFLFALLFSGTITDMVLRYSPESFPGGIPVVVYISGGFLLHALSFTGIILIWKMKRKGYLWFGIPTLIISAFQLLATHISPLTTAFYIIMLIALGLFYKKLK